MREVCGGAVRAEVAGLIRGDTRHRRVRSMELLDRRSLAATVNAVNDALFFRKRVARSEERRVAAWLTGRHGLREVARGEKVGGTGEAAGAVTAQNRDV